MSTKENNMNNEDKLVEMLRKILREYENLDGADEPCGTITQSTFDEARELLAEITAIRVAGTAD